MPIPIPVLGKIQVDPTLPNIIKSPLYAVDEYQTCDLLLWGSGNIVRKTGFNGFWWDLFFCKRNDDRIDLYDYGGSNTQFAVAIQRFSVWSYPWAEDLMKKLIDYVSVGQLIIEWRGLSIDISGAGDIKIYDTYKVNINNYPPITSALATRNLYTCFYGSPSLKSINFSFESQVDATVIITYLVQEYAENCDRYYSKQYKQFSVQKGLNEFRLQFKPDNTDTVVLNMSFVVSTYPSDNSLIEAVENAINNAVPNVNLLFKDFDRIISERTIKARADFMFNHSSALNLTDIPNYNAVEHFNFFGATNNYWNNGTYLNDINSSIQINPKLYILPREKSISEIDVVKYKRSSDGFYGNNMPDSIRVQEIHAALEAQKFANDSKNNNQRVANLGYFIERIARVLGINVYENGTTKSIRQARKVKTGETIAAGYEFGQFGLNAVGDKNGQFGGNPGELRDGIIYEQRSNKLIPDSFDPEKSQIEIGDYVLCENIPQLMMQILDDLDKALSWQEIGAGAIPSADGSKNVMLYEGLGSVVAENSYMLSKISGLIAQNLIATKVTQGISQEVLAGLGIPIGDKVFYESVGPDKDPVGIHYPAMLEEGITLTQQMGWILQNVGILVANSVVYDESSS
jgi:hypothetical protein